MWTTNKSQSAFKSTWESFGVVSLMRHIVWSNTLEVGVNSQPKYTATKKTRCLEAAGIMETGITTILNHTYEDTVDVAWWNSSGKLTATWVGGEFNGIHYLCRNNVSPTEAVWLLSEGLKKGDDAFIYSNGKAFEVKPHDPMMLFLILGLKFIPKEEWAVLTPGEVLALAQFEMFMRLGAENSIKLFEKETGTDVEFLKTMLNTFSEDTHKWSLEDGVF
jgi:hypothetical protein